MKKWLAIASIFTLVGTTSCKQPAQSGNSQDTNIASGDTLTGDISLSGAFALYPMVVRWADEFKKLCDANSMKIVSTHSSIQEDKNKEEEIMNRWRELFKIQKACGGKYFVIPSYGVDYTVQGLKDMCNYFNKVGKIAQEYGLTLGYHNHSNEFQKLKDSDDVMWEYLVEHTDPQYVCFELDVYWCAKGGKDPVEYLKKYPKRIQLLHIKDDFVIGEGTVVNFENVFNQFYKNKMKDFFVEIEIPQSLRDKTNADGSKYNNDQIMEEMFKAAEKSMQYLKNAKFVK